MTTEIEAWLARDAMRSRLEWPVVAEFMRETRGGEDLSERRRGELLHCRADEVINQVCVLWVLDYMECMDSRQMKDEDGRGRERGRERK